MTLNKCAIFVSLATVSIQMSGAAVTVEAKGVAAAASVAVPSGLRRAISAPVLSDRDLVITRQLARITRSTKETADFLANIETTIANATRPLPQPGIVGRIGSTV
ncbi:MAG TPA: hypothetical protein VLG71_02245, partial [Candidatus Limnocylindria bacterium]|nr:hypothetical protein [Candidatus Limnocylindria bacterium]